MGKYVLKRLCFILLTCFIALSLTYILLNCLKVPGIVTNKPGQLLAYYNNQVEKGFVVSLTSPSDAYGELLASVTTGSGVTETTYYFYSRPILERYGNWLSNVFLHWDWGVSNNFSVNQPVFDILINRLPTTISINIISVIISVPLGIGFGVLCALKKDSIFDNVSQLVIMAFISIPGFVLISYLIMGAYSTDWLPPFWPADTEPIARRIAGFIVPVTALSIGSIAGYARFVRAELCEVLSSEYLLLARTKGLTRGQAILRHAFRNSMVPVLPSVVSEFIAILGGSMILENLYQIRGVGQLYIAAFNSRDYDLLMVDMAFYTIIGLLAAIVVDLSYGFIDPRIRMGAKK